MSNESDQPLGETTPLDEQETSGEHIAVRRPTALSYHETLVRNGRRALAEMRRDTSEKELEISRAMTPEQRLKVSFGLYRTAWRLKESYMRKIHPDWSEQQIRAAMREAFLYGDF